MTVSSLYKSRKEIRRNGRKKKWHSTPSARNLKSSSCRESLGNYPSLYSFNTSSDVYKNESYGGHSTSLCNDVETNSN